MVSKKLKYTTEEFINIVKEKHGDAYDYSDTIYRGTYEKITIFCKTHGYFTKTPNSHLSGQGCPKCGIKKSADSNTYKVEEVVCKFMEVHGGKYSYDEVQYLGVHIKIKIKCSTHGEFKQSPAKHINGQGCPKCGKSSHWRRLDYIEKANGRICTFYAIRCFNENEVFYKIGITMNNIESRYSGIIKMPYEYEVINEIKGSAGFIWDLEKEEKRKLKQFHYTPITPFKGSLTECFTNISGI